jgi:hydrogenase maturation protease
MKILIAGFGNLLQNDDGFGVHLLRRLQSEALPTDVRLLDVGIGGISMVQELLTPCDALIVLDCIEGESPGDVRVMEVTPRTSRRSNPATNDEFADIHYAEPGRAISLAHEIGALPSKVYLVGCVAASTELGDQLSQEVEASLDAAVETVKRLLHSLGSSQPAGDHTQSRCSS